MSAPARTKEGGKIDELMEQASAALVDTDYFKAETVAIKAFEAAHRRQDYERMARILLPLQEARRQKTMQAVDEGVVYLFCDEVDDAEPGSPPTPKLGCWLISPPFVGADGRNLREAADAQQTPVLVIVEEPLTQLKLRPIVMIGPVTVRTKIKPVENWTPQDILAASEALGDAAIEDVDPSLPAPSRVEKLYERLQTVRQHEKLHQALMAACEDAAREAAEDE